MAINHQSAILSRAKLGRRSRERAKAFSWNFH